MFCPRCGASCGEGHRFCSVCGAVLTPEVLKTGSHLPPILIMVGLSLVGLVLFFLFPV